MDLRELIREYFGDCKTMQLATYGNGQPWLCTVYFTTDDELNIYWTSLKSRRHSKEILAHPKVAVAIVKDVERKQGLQITGEASIVEEENLEHVNKLYGNKLGDNPNRLTEIRTNSPDGRAYWVIKPSIISLWDEVNFPEHPKQEYIIQ